MDKKTNEIPVIQEVLQDLLLTGRVVTVDALLTQREIAKTILEKEGDYVMVVKGNQPQLLQDIQPLFEHPLLLKETFQTAKTLDDGRDRIEERRPARH